MTFRSSAVIGRLRSATLDVETLIGSVILVLALDKHRTWPPTARQSSERIASEPEGRQQRRAANLLSVPSPRAAASGVGLPERT